MAIRVKHIDHRTPGMTLYQTTSLGDITADAIARTVFYAPVACVVDYVEFISRQTVSGTSASAQQRITLHPTNASASTIQVRGTSGTATTTNDISANTPYRLTPSANNSLTAGVGIVAQFSQGGSGVLSAVNVLVAYRPQVHVLR